MPIGPTNKERQKFAFELLRDQARSAHIQSDGLKVANLVETAAQEVKTLLEKDKFLLSVSDIQWIIIFRIFWLHTGISNSSTEQLLHNLTKAN